MMAEIQSRHLTAELRKQGWKRVREDTLETGEYILTTDRYVRYGGTGEKYPKVYYLGKNMFHAWNPFKKLCKVCSSPEGACAWAVWGQTIEDSELVDEFTNHDPTNPRISLEVKE